MKPFGISIPILSLTKRLEAEIVARVEKNRTLEAIDTAGAALIKAIRGE